MAASATLTVAAGKVASDLTGFPVRVDLSHLSATWWADTTSDLGNVRVKQAGTVIPFDVVAYDRTAKTGELFFRAPSLLAASPNVFTVETVNGATALAATDPNGRNAVWTDYMAVFVTSGVGMADRLKDRAGKSGDLTVATGTLGTPTNAGWLKGSGDVNVKSVGVGFQQTYHFAATYVLATASGNNSFIAYSTDSSTDSARETMGLESGDNLAMWNSTDSFLEHLGSLAATPNTAPGARERAVGVKIGTTSRYMYKNGVKGTVDTTVAARPASPGNALWLLCGGGATTSRFFGEINYAYLRSGTPSDSWVAAEYASWETPASLYTVTILSATIPATSGVQATATANRVGSATAAATAAQQATATAARLGAATIDASSGASAAASTPGAYNATVTFVATSSVEASGSGSVSDLAPAGGYGFAIAADLAVLALPPVPEIPDLVPAGLFAVSVPAPTLVDGRPQ